MNTFQRVLIFLSALSTFASGVALWSVKVQFKRIQAVEERNKVAIDELEESVKVAIGIIGEALPKDFKKNVNRIFIERSRANLKNVEEALKEIKK